MESDPDAPLDLGALQRTAAAAARQASRNHHDREDFTQQALLEAWRLTRRVPADRRQLFAAQRARWAVKDARRALSRRVAPEQLQEGDAVARGPGPTEVVLRRHLADLEDARQAVKAVLRRHGPPPLRRPVGVPDLEGLARLQPLDVVIRAHCRRALELAGFQLRAAARQLGIGRATMYRWVHRDASLLGTPPTPAAPATAD